MTDHPCPQCNWWAPARICSGCGKMICILCWLTGNCLCEDCLAKRLASVKNLIAASQPTLSRQLNH